MSHGHIIEGIEQFSTHLVQAAYGQLLRVAAGRTGDKLVGNQDIAAIFPFLMFRHMLQSPADRIFKGFNAFLRAAPSHNSRFYKGQHIDPQASVPVLQLNRLQMTVIHRRHINSPVLHKLPSKGQPLRAVVVPADNKHGQVPVRQPGQESVKDLYCLSRRHRFIINIPGYENTVRHFLLRNHDNLV